MAAGVSQTQFQMVPVQIQAIKDQVQGMKAHVQDMYSMFEDVHAQVQRIEPPELVSVSAQASFEELLAQAKAHGLAQQHFSCELHQMRTQQREDMVKVLTVLGNLFSCMQVRGPRTKAKVCTKQRIRHQDVLGELSESECKRSHDICPLESSDDLSERLVSPPPRLSWTANSDSGGKDEFGPCSADEAALANCLEQHMVLGNAQEDYEEAEAEPCPEMRHTGIPEVPLLPLNSVNLPSCTRGNTSPPCRASQLRPPCAASRPGSRDSREPPPPIVDSAWRTAADLQPRSRASRDHPPVVPLAADCRRPASQPRRRRPKAVVDSAWRTAADLQPRQCRARTASPPEPEVPIEAVLELPEVAIAEPEPPPVLDSTCEEIHPCGSRSVVDSFLKEVSSATASQKPQGINTRDRRGLTVLHRAAELGRAEVARAILDDDDFTEANAQDGWHRRTALHMAATKGDRGVARVLLEHPSFTAADTQDGWPSQTALHIAAQRGDLALARLLLDCPRFAAADAKDNTGQTALHIAAERGDLPLVELLLDHDRFDAHGAQSRYGRTALHRAAAEGHASVVAAVLGHPNFHAADARTAYGRTALHVAAWHGHQEASRVIFEHPRFTEAAAQDREGLSALDLAVRYGHAEVAAMLRGKCRDRAAQPSASAARPSSQGSVRRAGSSAASPPAAPGGPRAKPCGAALARQAPGRAFAAGPPQGSAGGTHHHGRVLRGGETVLAKQDVSGSFPAGPPQQLPGPSVSVPSPAAARRISAAAPCCASRVYG